MLVKRLRQDKSYKLSSIAFRAAVDSSTASANPESLAAEPNIIIRNAEGESHTPGV